jgi:hypothetical protein
VITPLVLVGAVWAARKMQGGVAALVMLIGLTASSFLIAEGVAVAFTFRLPMLLAALGFAGMGLLAVIRRLAPSSGRARPIVASAIVAAVAISPVLLPGWSIVARTSPSTAEYDVLRALAPSLPPGASVIQYPWRSPQYRFPQHLLARGRTAATNTTGPTLFWRGIGCSAFALGPSAQRVGMESTLSELTFPPTVGEFPELPSDTAPGALRPECVEALVGAKPVGPAYVIDTPSDWDRPFAVYSAPSVEVQMFQLTPEGVQALQKQPDEQR